MAQRSPEHAFPRSIGFNDFVVAVHPECNAQANRSIDQQLVRCGKINHARAELGVVSSRTGEPYTERLVGETVAMAQFPENSKLDIRNERDLHHLFRTAQPYAPPGARVRVSRAGEDLAARFLGNRIRGDDGVFNVFQSDEDVPESDGSDGQRVVALVEATRRCSHTADTWRRFTAKVGLVFVDLIAQSDGLLEDGFPTRDVVSREDIVRLTADLRQIAFGPPTTPDYPAEPFATEAEYRHRPSHLVGIEHHGSHAVVAVRLFDSLNYRITVPDIQVAHSAQ